jgi:hypothetical protein
VTPDLRRLAQVDAIVDKTCIAVRRQKILAQRANTGDGLASSLAIACDSLPASLLQREDAINLTKVRSPRSSLP